MSIQIKGNIVDINAEKVYAGEITVAAGKIQAVRMLHAEQQDGWPFIMPGFIDAHVHIESSMLVPSSFARLAVIHGTVATVSDPHEIANVCGMDGVEYMIENGKQVPFKFYFGAPSCVPATIFETAGASLNVEEVTALLAKDEIHYLSEMMNFPGVLHGDKDVMAKIEAARQMHKPVDGHAPGLRGNDALQYIAAGISTDHECFTEDEAREKLEAGMKIIIREGSAAKNFDALYPLLETHSSQLMFCSDDKHPDSLLQGHINLLCSRAVANGISLFNVLKAACINPVTHYHLQVGLLRENDPADFVVVNDLKSFSILQTYIDGQLVAKNGISMIPHIVATPINNFSCTHKTVKDFLSPAPPNAPDFLTIPVIEVLDGQLITKKLAEKIANKNGVLVPDVSRDLLKIVVVNRYNDAPIKTAFIKNVGLKRGAIASSVAHDSHNIVAVGVDDESICIAVNSIIKEKGGISATDGKELTVLPLPVAGLMSVDDAYSVANAYTAIDAKAKALGSLLGAPFMSLSFMALLVIPHLKLSDKGLFDGDSFTLI